VWAADAELGVTNNLGLGSCMAGNLTVYPMYRFAAVVAVPGAVTLLFPAAGDTARADSALFCWNRAQPSVTRYWFELATDSSMSAAVIDSNQTDTTRLTRALADFTTYWWRVRAQNSAGWGEFSPKSSFVVHLRATTALPACFGAGLATSIGGSSLVRYSIPHACNASMVLYTLLGRKVVSLVNGMQSAGSYTVPLNARVMAHGLYVLLFRAGEYAVKRQVMW